MELSYRRITLPVLSPAWGQQGERLSPWNQGERLDVALFAHLCHTHFQGPLTAFPLLSTREKSFQGLQSTPLSQRGRRKGKSGYAGTC